MKRITMRALSVSIVTWSFILFQSRTITNVAADKPTLGQDFYMFTVMDIYENIVSLEQYRGKVSLVVNVASECGYTDHHYKSLVRLQELLADTKKFNVLAFPCNQFGEQEPGSNRKIHNFATKKYGVNFPMFAKVDVKGEDALDAWKYLAEHGRQEPDWNFWKYLIDANGKVVDSWGPWMDPDKLYNIIMQKIKKIKPDSKSKSSKSSTKSSHGGEL